MNIQILSFVTNSSMKDFNKFRTNFLNLNATDDYTFTFKTYSNISDYHDRINILNTECQDDNFDYTILCTPTTICNKSIAPLLNNLNTLSEVFKLAGTVDSSLSNTWKLFVENYEIADEFFIIDSRFCIINNRTYQEIDLSEITDIFETVNDAMSTVLSLYLNNHVILPYISMSSLNANVLDIENCYTGDLEDSEDKEPLEGNDEYSKFVSPAMIFLDKYDQKEAQFKYSLLSREELLNEYKMIFTQLFLTNGQVSLTKI